jgi:predicted HTH transcriptional regulator
VIQLSDDDLLRMRRDTENNFVERKTVSDKEGWLRTAVAFANSVPIEYPAVLFVGVKDDGELENVAANFDWEKLQKTVAEQMGRAYPPLHFLPKMLRVDTSEFLAVIIPGSSERPHFAGKAYIRVGPETKEASDGQFDILVAQRLSKVYEIQKWKGKRVSVETMRHAHSPAISPVESEMERIVEDCNQFYVSLSLPGVAPGHPQTVAHTLRLVEISFDHPRNQLKLVVWRV